ncbi:MAG: glycine--tRNA ligase subunit beta [Enterococcus sp.]
MAKDLLLEIGLEEMPAHVVTPSMNQLVEKTEKFLAENYLTFESIKGLSTPRRLAVQVFGLAEKQADIEEEIKGPAKKIALDAEGNWSKAALGFVRGQGVTPEDITFKELKGVEYVYVTKFTKGKTAQEVLTDLPNVITSLTFPVTMSWGDHDFQYIRPIHWITALLDEEVIPFSLLDIQTDRTSRGQRFLGEDVSFANATEYVEKLAEQFVIVDPSERKALISEQINEIASKNNWSIELDAKLLEEVNNLVEYPTAFVGDYEEKYLAVPEEVLVTSMKEHQRYFDVRATDGTLLPHFVSVRNGDAVKIQNVIKGNQKVLTARLEDAEFFFAEDQKLTIAACVAKLKNVAFHEKIGSIHEKMQRVGAIAQIIGEQVGLSSEELLDLQRASAIYKFDLVTNMVGEFPELQGIMGEKYALAQGENAAVAKALREHYLPISSEGELPVSNVGTVLAIADKLDSLFAFFAVGLIPSGSNDPYALRRQTYGVVRIIEAKGWSFPLADLQVAIDEVINQDVATFGIEFASGQEEILEFFNARLKQFFSTKAIRHDVIDAVIQSNQKDLTQLFAAVDVLQGHVEDEAFKPSVEALTRAINLAKKLEATVAVDAKLFENDAETELYQGVIVLEEKFTNQTVAENFVALTQLRPLIEAYFEQTMVMVEDDTIRQNRLATLSKIAEMSLVIASLDLLLTK